MFNPTNDCIILEKLNPKGDIYLFHGVNSSAGRNLKIINKLIDKTDYNVIACDARGHGMRREWDKHDWTGTLADYRSIMNQRKNNEKIFIGKSMGSSLAFKLAQEFKPKKVFAIGSPYNESVKEKWGWLSKLKYTKTIVDNKSILPSTSNYSSKSIYLIHTPQDKVITQSEFEKNAKKFNVPKERTLSVPYRTTFMAHERLGIDKKTWNYITKTIQGH